MARLDKSRPVLVLTRELVRPHMNTVTVAPITTTIRGLSTEVRVGTTSGIEGEGVIACDHITTIPVAALGRQIGRLLDDQDADLTDAIHAAFDLD
jgi:mRNA interferase MazF